MMSDAAVQRPPRPGLRRGTRRLVVAAVWGNLIGLSLVTAVFEGYGLVVSLEGGYMLILHFGLGVVALNGSQNQKPRYLSLFMGFELIPYLIPLFLGVAFDPDYFFLLAWSLIYTPATLLPQLLLILSVLIQGEPKLTPC